MYAIHYVDVKIESTLKSHTGADSEQLRHQMHGFILVSSTQNVFDALASRLSLPSFGSI